MRQRVIEISCERGIQQSCRRGNISHDILYRPLNERKIATCRNCGHEIVMLGDYEEEQTVYHENNKSQTHATTQIITHQYWVHTSNEEHCCLKAMPKTEFMLKKLRGTAKNTSAYPESEVKE